MITKSLLKTLVYWTAVALLALTVVGLLLHGAEFLDEDARAREIVQERISELRAVDPTAANALERIAERRKARDLAPAVQAAHGDMSKLRSFTNRANERETFEVRLARIANEAGISRDREHLEAYFVAHATACQTFEQDNAHAVLEEYLNGLAHASRNPSVWEVVQDDPFGLVIYPHIRHKPDLWAFYAEHRDWLQEPLAAIGYPEDEYADEVVAGSESDMPSVEEMLVETLEVARQYHPLTKQTVADLDFGYYGFGLFMSHGDVIERAATTYGLPLEEVLEVTFANSDQLEVDPDLAPDAYDRLITEYADELNYIHTNQPEVWDLARSFGLVLRLRRDAPDSASRVLELFGEEGISEFLYAYYEPQLEAAAGTLEQYEDLGFYYLIEYKEDERVAELLEHEDVGLRLVPYLASRSEDGVDAALAELQDYPGRAARDFDESGEEISHLIDRVPIVGGPTRVVRNWAQGYPNEWSDYGWAAFDAGSTVLLVASLGTSSGIQTGVAAARGAASAAARSTAARITTQTATRGLARVATGRTASLLRSVTHTMRGARGGAALTGAALTRPIVYGGKAVFHGARMAYSRAVHVARTTFQTLRRYPMISRALFGAALAYSVYQRDLIPAAAGSVGEAITSTLVRTSSELGRGLATGMQDIWDPGAQAGTFAQHLRYYGILTLSLLLLLVLLARPILQKKTIRKEKLQRA